MNTSESDENIAQIHIETSVGKLICAGTPNPTTLAQANKNRKKLGLPPYGRKRLGLRHLVMLGVFILAAIIFRK